MNIIIPRPVKENQWTFVLTFGRDFMASQLARDELIIPKIYLLVLGFVKFKEVVGQGVSLFPSSYRGYMVHIQFSRKKLCKIIYKG